MLDLISCNFYFHFGRVFEWLIDFGIARRIPHMNSFQQWMMWVLNLKFNPKKNKKNRMKLLLLLLWAIVTTTTTAERERERNKQHRISPRYINILFCGRSYVDLSKAIETFLCFSLNRFEFLFCWLILARLTHKACTHTIQQLNSTKRFESIFNNSDRIWYGWWARSFGCFPKKRNRNKIR